MTKAASTTTAKKKPKKIFVLDTSVLLFDHNSINNFAEHDVAIPITVLEELDKFKVGNDTKNYEAREVIRFLDKLSGSESMQDWISLGKGKGNFKVIMNSSVGSVDAEEVYGMGKNDHKILNAALTVEKNNKTKKVIMVSKDINLRLKAKAVGLVAEDYLTGKVEDVKELNKSLITISDLDSDIIRELFQKGVHENVDILGDQKVANGYYVLKNGSSSSLAFYNPRDQVIERVEKELCYGIKPKNAEQTFAINAILNPDIKLISLQGVAGTGKTLLALAGAIEQRKLYNQIILARPIVPLSNRDIGYLPGDASEKISPYMEPLWDNLKFIKNQFKETSKQHKQILEMEENGKIIITPLAYIRGRSFSNIIFIIDEAQNLTPHEVKTIITRAGENTKIIFTGDIAQIDTPYLDEQSNGLAYLIDRLKGHPIFAHIKLEKGERSELANVANELL
ncbi:MAG: PhoH family protein [Crocinitomicaceae bacterium]|nr:PhoH family protein [Crocinitomicaceae bacterium]